MTDSVFLNSEFKLTDIDRDLKIISNPKPFYKKNDSKLFDYLLLFLLLFGVVVLIIYIYCE